MFHHSVFIVGGTGYIGGRIVPMLLERECRVRLLVRRGSEHKVPSGCDVHVGDPFARATWEAAIEPGCTFVQLLGVPHPSPSKAQQFVDIDRRSALESIAAARTRQAGHFVYVSVAQPAPIMRAYQAVRAEVERALEQSGMRHTVLRPWYVLGPGHWWPYALVPFYRVMEWIPATSPSAHRCGLVTLEQMAAALVDVIEQPPPAQQRVIEVPEIRRAALRSAESRRAPAAP